MIAAQCSLSPKRVKIRLVILKYLGIAAPVQAAAVRVCDASDVHAVERLVARIASSAPASTPAVLEDAKEIAGVGYKTAAVVAVERGEVPLACLCQVLNRVGAPKSVLPLFPLLFFFGHDGFRVKLIGRVSGACA